MITIDPIVQESATMDSDSSPLNPTIQAAIDVLAQSANLLMALDDDDYRRKTGHVFDASIGSHIRHCLDHFTSIIDGLDTGEIDYDNRQRDVQLEQDRSSALQATRRILDSVSTLNSALLPRPIRVRAKVAYDQRPSPTVASTVEREVMFAVIHAIHHNALIGVIAKFLDLRLPEGFGVAPATLQHQARQLAA